MELIFYDIYHNQPIKKELFQGLDEFDLWLAKNMVFAKYNYEFDTPYLQAYFNLFSFYVNAQTPRTKNVNPLLTPADKQNLSLIRAKIEKREQE